MGHHHSDTPVGPSSWQLPRRGRRHRESTAEKARGRGKLGRGIHTPDTDARSLRRLRSGLPSGPMRRCVQSLRRLFRSFAAAASVNKLVSLRRRIREVPIRSRSLPVQHADRLSEVVATARHRDIRLRRLESGPLCVFQLWRQTTLLGTKEIRSKEMEKRREDEKHENGTRRLKDEARLGRRCLALPGRVLWKGPRCWSGGPVTAHAGRQWLCKPMGSDAGELLWSKRVLPELETKTIRLKREREIK